MSKIQFKFGSKEDLKEYVRLEGLSFPSDEKASPEKMKYRMENFPMLFLGMMKDGNTIGHVCATLFDSPLVTHDSMETECPKDGTTICVHSVVVDPEQRKNGYGLLMMKHYVDNVKKAYDHTNRIALLCKKDLIRFYERSGFKLLGKSKVAHGKDDWFDMIIEF